jgi:hypothetical protein
LLAEYGHSSVVAIRYHGDTPWEFDPFYSANPVEVEERLDYYSATIPANAVDGVLIDRTCYVTKVRDMIDAVLEVDSPLKITATDSRVGDSCFVDIQVIGEADSGNDSLVLRAAVVEDSIDYDAPNGLSLFNYVFRRFAPDHAGTVFTISEGETLDFSLAFELDPGWDTSYVSTVVFCQDDWSGAVIQAVSTKPRPGTWGRYWASQRGRVVLPGNTVQFPGTFTNRGSQADTFDLVLATDLPAGWTSQYSVSGGVDLGGAVVLESDSTSAVTVSITSGLEAGTGSCTMTLTSRRDPAFSRSLSFFAVSGVCALVIDDDGGLGLESYYADALDSLGIVWGHWDRSIAKPSVSDLHRGEFVIWFTGGYFPTLEVYDQDLIGSYLDTGGNLFITGQDIGYALNYVNNEEYSPEAVTFYETYLRADWITSSSLLWNVSGINGDPISDGLTFSIEGGDGADNQDYPDVIDVIAPATLIFDYTGDPLKHCGVRYDSGTSKMVYLSFGFEAIATRQDRELLLSRIADWFGKTSGVEPPPAGLAVSAYPNPAVTHLNIALSHSRDGGRVVVHDVMGRRVKTLWTAPGETLTWNLADEGGRKVAPGVYFITVSAEDMTVSKKVVLAK